jgi:hypothetical protein
MNYHWTTDARTPRQHWLYADKQTRGLVYELRPGNAYSVYGEDYQKNPFARVFLGVFPTLGEAKDFLVTITASQNI